MRHSLLAICLLALLPAVPGRAADPSAKNSDVISASDRYIPQIIFGGEWITTLMMGNLNDKPVTIPITVYDGANGQLISFPVTGVGLVSQHTVTIPPFGTMRVEIADPNAGGATLGFGYADIPCTSTITGTCGNIMGLVILRNRNPTRPDFESTYRFTDGDRKRLIFLDQAEYFQTVGVISLPKRFATDTAPSRMTMRIYNEQGQRIYLDEFNMIPGGSRLINFAAEMPFTIGVRGYIEVEGDNRQILFSGIRINPSNAFTPLDGFTPQGE